MSVVHSKREWQERVATLALLRSSESARQAFRQAFPRLLEGHEYQVASSLAKEWPVGTVARMLDRRDIYRYTGRGTLHVVVGYAGASVAVCVIGWVRALASEAQRDKTMLRLGGLFMVDPTELTPASLDDLDEAEVLARLPAES